MREDETPWPAGGWHTPSRTRDTVRTKGRDEIAVAIATADRQAWDETKKGDILLRLKDSTNKIQHAVLSRGDAWELAQKLLKLANAPEED